MNATYWDLANSWMMWVLVIIGLAFIALLAAIFLVKAYKRSLALGVSKDTLKRTITSSITFTILPSISMLLGLFTLSSVLGAPWAWFRLSVLGNTAYELLAANEVAAGVGYGNLIEARTAAGSIFGAGAIVMSVAIIGGTVVNAIVGKKIITSVTGYAKGNASWGIVFSSCFMMALVAVFVPTEMTKGSVEALTLLTSAVITIFLTLLAKKLRASRLEEFVLPIALIGGMVCSVFFHNLLTGGTL